MKQVTSNDIMNNSIHTTKTAIMMINKNANKSNDTNLNIKSISGNEINLYLDGIVSTNKLLDVSTPSLIDTGKIKGLQDLVAP